MASAGVRIAGGAWRGRVLEVPGSARPSSARLRAALGSIWAAKWRDARMLDLFAGSGAVGIEALSRGAARVLFVEAERRAAAVLERNLTTLGATAARVVVNEAGAALERLAATTERFDLLFADPPYELSWNRSWGFGMARIATAGAALAVERRTGNELSELAGWRALGSYRYGDSWLGTFEPAP